jgi:hypothetical protein
MIPDERERIMALCEQIVKEQDPKDFAELLLKLRHLLDRTNGRLAIELRDVEQLHQLQN